VFGCDPYADTYALGVVERLAYPGDSGSCMPEFAGFAVSGSDWPVFIRDQLTRRVAEYTV
jgi:hypothetical protein